MLKHVDRHLNEVVSMKCSNKCRGSWISKEVFTFTKDHGMRLFTPTISTNCDGHYETFLKSCLATEHKYGDWGQPSKTEKDLGVLRPKRTDMSVFSIVTRRTKLTNLETKSVMFAMLLLEA